MGGLKNAILLLEAVSDHGLQNQRDRLLSLRRFKVCREAIHPVHDGIRNERKKAMFSMQTAEGERISSDVSSDGTVAVELRKHWSTSLDE